MKLLKLLFVVLLFSCNDDSSESLETGEPKQIVVAMMNPNATDITNVTGTYNLEKNKEYCVREDGKYKILLTKSEYEDKEKKKQEILTYSIFDVANQKYLYYTTGIDVAKRLEKEWKYYRTYDPEKVDIQNPVCTSNIKEE